MAAPYSIILFSALLLLFVACDSAPADTQTVVAPLPATAEPAVTHAPTAMLPPPDPLTPPSPVSFPSVTPDASLGEQIYLNYGCNACHSTDGTALVGPTWQGLYGTEEELKGGTSVLVDDAYITESIRDPNAKITRGFTAGLMPATLGVKDEEIPHIIEYMKSLR